MSQPPQAEDLPVFSVCLGCYGDYPHYSLRALDSIVQNASGDVSFDLLVGLNACGTETRRGVQQYFEANAISLYVESRQNRNKDTMFGILLRAVRTEYLLWMDDDSILGGGWDALIANFIERNQPFDAAGHVFYCDRSPEYLAFLQRRPWYRRPPKENIVWFPTGGLFLARTAFLRAQHFPDFAMVKQQDDLLLGDCLEQAGGKLVDFSHDRPLMDCIQISAGNRRGSGEGGHGSGWLDVCPVTGF